MPNKAYLWKKSSGTQVIDVVRTLVLNASAVMPFRRTVIGGIYPAPRSPSLIFDQHQIKVD
jgi:hypothetical protein